MDTEHLLPKRGGYRKLKSFLVAQLVYDVTVRFCNKYISRRSRTHDQMVQAARSGVQNIAEGSIASATSKKIELKLTNIARASLEELRLDYEDFLRQRKLPIWERSDARRSELIALRVTTADETARWVKRQYERQNNVNSSAASIASAASAVPGKTKHQAPTTLEEIAANAALALITVACSLLDRQIISLAATFEQEGGFTERMHRIRTQRRNKGAAGR